MRHNVWSPSRIPVTYRACVCLRCSIPAIMCGIAPPTIWRLAGNGRGRTSLMASFTVLLFLGCLSIIVSCPTISPLVYIVSQYAVPWLPKLWTFKIIFWWLLGIHCSKLEYQLLRPQEFTSVCLLNLWCYCGLPARSHHSKFIRRYCYFFPPGSIVASLLKCSFSATWTLFRLFSHGFQERKIPALSRYSPFGSLKPYLAHQPAVGWSYVRCVLPFNH